MTLGPKRGGQSGQEYRWDADRIQWPVGKGTSWIPTVSVETCLRLGPEVVSHLGAAPTPGPVVTQATLSFAY